jgi:hypothetical protein
MTEDKENEVVASLTGEQLQEAVVKGQPKIRRIVIETDGQTVNIPPDKCEITPLELRAICQMLLGQDRK